MVTFRERSTRETDRSTVFGAVRRRSFFLTVIISILVLGFTPPSDNATPLAAFATVPAASTSGEGAPLLREEDDVLRSVFPPGTSKAGRDPRTARELIAAQNLFSPLAASVKPNIVVILTDDQPPGTIGLSGNSVIQTPKIDALRNRGVYFTNMYLPIGQCAPSRASLWTGKLPHNHTVVTNGLKLPFDHVTLPQVLKANGYQTGFVGKCNLGPPDIQLDGSSPDTFLVAQGFDRRVVMYPDSGASNWNVYEIMINGTRYVSLKYLTNFLTDEAISFISTSAQAYQTTGQPFFLWLAHLAPHEPTTPPAGSNRYDPNLLPTPSAANDDLTSKPPQQQTSLAHRRYQSATSDGAKAKLKDAYEVISNIDDNVGRIMDTLNQYGLTDNTIVIFLSDNGVYFGEHQLLTKGPFFYNEQIKTPFIFSYPAMISSGRTTAALAGSIDIFPTLLDLLQINPPAGIEGKSFLPIIKNTATTFRSSMYMEYASQPENDTNMIQYPMRGVVTSRYKWTHYLPSTVIIDNLNQCPGGVNPCDGKDYEFYDLTADPQEMTNILKRLSPSDNPLMRMLQDKTYGKAIRDVRKEAAIWQTDSLDPLRQTISNLAGKALSATSVQLTWATAATTTSEVEFRLSSCATCTYTEKNDFRLVTSHSVKVAGLTKSTTYSFRVFSIGDTGNGTYALATVTTPAR